MWTQGLILRHYFHAKTCRGIKEWSLHTAMSCPFLRKKTSRRNAGDCSRPLLSGWLILYRGGGGGQRPKKVCVPKIDLQVRAPLINFIFCLRKNFLMWVGGWVSQNPGGPI